MQFLFLLAAVLLSSEAATVPPVITHKVSAPLPGSVGEVEIPAVVVEVSKDHQHNPDAHLELKDNPGVTTTVLPLIPEVVTATLEHVGDKVSGVVVTTVKTPTGEVPVVVAVPHKPVEVSVNTPMGVEPKITTVQPKTDEVSEVSVNTPMGVEPKVTTVQPKKDEVSEVMVTTVQPMDKEVKTTVPVKSQRLVNEEAGGEETTTMQGITEDVVQDLVTTVVPLSDDMATKSLMDDIVTTIEPNSEDVATNQPTHIETPKHDTHSKSSEEDTSSSSSSSSEDGKKEHLKETVETPRDDLIPAILHRPHIKDEGTVPHITPTPPITADENSSGSSEEEKDDSNVSQHVTKVPLETDKVVVRRRRAQPFFIKSQLATAKPKLVTNPKVIADIVAKSKSVHLQKRVMRSVTNSPVVDSTSSTIDPCDLLCTKFEIDPVCATNGLCLHEFANQCVMDTYNCRHPKQKFSATRDDRCQMHWLEFCKESDMI